MTRTSDPLPHTHGRAAHTRSLVDVLVALMAAVMVAAVTAVITSNSPAAALRTGSTGACVGSDGVTVVVDFGNLAGGTVVRCAPGSPASGLDALRDAGFDVRGVARFPGFVCRIDGAPASSPCLDTPPPDAYWSYWTAERGGTWSYSDTGAASRTPSPGSVEGWSFSDGRDTAPRLAPPPPALPAASPAPPPAPPADVAPVGAAPAVPEAGPDRAAPPVPAAPVRPGVTDPTDVAPSPPAMPPAEVAGVTTSVAPALPDGRARGAEPATPAERDATDDEPGPSRREAAAATGADDPSSTGGSPFGTVLGLGLVAVLGAVAVVVVRRRRAADA